jgi:hypothetical protein
MLGVAGGATIGYWGYEHMFGGAGMTEDERKNVAAYAVTAGILLVATGLGAGDWLTVEGLGAKLDRLLGSL